MRQNHDAPELITKRTTQRSLPECKSSESCKAVRIRRWGAATKRRTTHTHTSRPENFQFLYEIRLFSNRRDEKTFFESSLSSVSGDERARGNLIFRTKIGRLQLLREYSFLLMLIYFFSFHILPNFFAGD